jgi:phage baseplate assembly protein W
MAIFTKPLSTNTRKWADLDLDFTAHPVTKDIVLKKDVEAVKRSVRNLILTNPHERPFHPEIGSGITGILFELVSPTTAVVLQSEIRQVITNFEPRVRLIDISVLGDIDKNGYYVTIKFQVINIPNPVTIELFLERLR